jgi:hypothetical protein
MLTGCGGAGSGSPPPFCCPAAPPNMLVAERGADEVAIYPRQFTNGSVLPTLTIPAPGAESIIVGNDVTTSAYQAIGLPILYVGEYPGTVAIIDSPYTAVNGTIATGVNDPAALAAGGFNGSEALFVANRAANNVVIYAGVNLNSALPTATIPGFNAPDGLAFDAQGNLWVAQASSVVELTPPFTANSVPAVSITTGLKSPTGIAFDQSGSMYVADKGNSAIVVYSSGSVTPSATVKNGIDGPVSPLIPYQTGFFPDELFVPNVTGNTISEFSLPLTSTSRPFVTISGGTNEPSAITFLTVSN